jgi:hypothetical protein
MFAEHYEPTVEDFKRLWAEGFFALDANVLLNLYRYGEGARSDFFKVVEALGSRVWVPHQAAMEYQRNRLKVIADQLKKFRDVRNAIKVKRIEEALNPYSDPARSPFKTDAFLETLRKAVGEFEAYLQTVEDQQIRVDSDDPVRTKLDSLFDRRVGTPYSQEQLDLIFAEGKIRYERKTPPGFADPKKKEPDAYEHGGRLYQRQFGDLVLWKQILECTAAQGIKDLALVTDDRTHDWWEIVDDDGPKTIGPRPELRAEIRETSGVRLFHMYQTDRFLKFGGEFLNLPVETASVAQVQTVREVDSMRDAAISFVSGSGWDFDRGAVVFRALVNGKNVPCLISEESLQDHFGADPGGGGAEMKATFERNRRAIEVIARDAIRDGRIDANGMVLIRSEDVEVGLARKTLEELKRYGIILATQARELAAKLGQDGGVVSARSTDDLETVLKEVSDAHELLADIRSRVPGEIDPVAWERTKVEDGRTGEEIFERLGDVIHDVIRAKRKLES